MSTEIAQLPETRCPDVLFPDEQAPYTGIMSDFIAYAKSERQHSTDLYDKEISIQKARLLSGKYTFEQEEQISDRIREAVSCQEKANHDRDMVVGGTIIASIGVSCIIWGLFRVFS